MSIATLEASPALSVPLDKIDVSNPDLFVNDTVGEYFARLRKEDPVHYCAESAYGPYWSITKYRDIMAVDTNHKVFSSEAGVGGIIIDDNLVVLEKTIRERMQNILDRLPVGEEFDWVDNVSIELTTQMLATLFDYPFEHRRKLTRWSDVTTAEPGSGIIDSWEQRSRELQECAASFMTLWNERVNAKEPGNDLISMLAHSPATRNMPPEEFLGNILLLIVGGNDTTRNSMTGSVLALNRFPEQFEKLKANHALVDSMVPEVIRWQTPLAHMRRTALEDQEVGGKTIKKGDKVIMWYLSGNRDEEEIERPEELIIDRARPRQHLSFGFGVHRCVGNRLAEMQLKILWEEILARFSHIEVLKEPERVRSNFVRGYAYMPVRLHA
jgi:cytochrome P450